MKVFIYDNKEKDVDGKYQKELQILLDKENISYQQLLDEDLSSKKTADAIFTLGGDGTMLCVVEFANRNNIPIIGINVGKIGFLTEFERLEMLEAVTLFKQSKLVKEERLTLEVNFKDKTTFALNDTFIYRIYNESIGSMTADIVVKIDNKFAERYKGDGVIVSSPTGSTAYSLSVGGPIMTPDVDALLVTPIAAHALGVRSIVFSANSVCQIELTGNAHGYVGADGTTLGQIKKGEVITIKKSKTNTTFLRKPDSDFYKRLSKKLKDGFED